MARHLTAALIAVLAIVACAHAQDISVPMGPDEGWASSAGWTGVAGAEQYSHTLEDGVAVFRASGGGATMIWLRSLADLGDLSGIRFASLRYRAEGIDPNLFSYFLYADAGDESGFSGKNILLEASNLIIDGEWHIATAPIDLGAPIARIGLRFAGLAEQEGRVDVEWLRLTAEPPRFPIAQTLPWTPADPPAHAIPLDGLRNLGLAETQQALALADWFDAPAVEVSGARFAVPSGDPVALATERKETTLTEIPVGMAAPELHLLMGGEFAPRMLGYHGYENGDRMWMPTEFLITLHYADGSAVEQMPFCVDTADYGVWRGLHVYALTADPAKSIDHITIRDGATYNRFVLIAATAAETATLMPELPGEARATPAGEEPPAQEPSIQVIGPDDARGALVGVIAAQSGVGRLAFDPRIGCSLIGLGNRRYPQASFTTGRGVPLFAVREGFTTWEGDAFTEVGREVDDESATVTMRSDEARAEVRVTITPLEGDEVQVGFTVRNLADEPRRLDLTLPRATFTCQDPWYLYPAMAVSWSNRDRVLRQTQAGYFPVQFMDAYDRTSGGGLYLMTRDTEGLLRQYVLAKSGNDITQSIEYQYQNFAGGQTREYPSAFLGVHGGDWRVAWERYRDWLRTWQQPMVPRNDWFRRVWNFRTSWVKFFKGDTWIDPETGQYRTAEMIARDTELFGPVDMNHFFDWRQSEQYGRWGDYNHFEEIGGLDAFRQMIADHHAAGIRVGLYLDVYLCSKKSEIGQAHGEEWAITRENGTFPGGYSTPDDPVWNMCVWHPAWRDYLSSRCAEAARMTGADGVYIDEGGADLRNYWCWRADHPHEVPGCSQEGFLELCRETRAKIPVDTVLYTEVAPADFIIPYIDGGYTTAMGRSDFQICPSFVHIHRFAFPDFKLFPITSAGSISFGIWDGLRYSVFNGCAMYSLSWGHDPEAFELIRKAGALLHAHEDAFLSMAPEMFVPTMAEEVYCNRFPGETETVWTLCSGRWQSYSGPVLRVPHVEGATYRDLWNDRELSPRIEGGFATIELDLGARNIGVIAQVRG